MEEAPKMEDVRPFALFVDSFACILNFLQHGCGIGVVSAGLLSETSPNYVF